LGSEPQAVSPPAAAARTLSHHLLALIALAGCALSAVVLARAPAWPAAFAPLPAPPSCAGVPRFETSVLRAAAPRFAHAASTVTLRDGRLRAFWYEGARELAPDVALWTAVYDGSTWSRPRLAFDAAATAVATGLYVRKLGNAVVYRDAGGDLVLIFASIGVGGWSGASLNFARSTDDGETWSSPRRLVTTATLNFSTLVKGKPIPLDGGFMLVPSYQGFVRRIAEALLLDPAGRVVGRRRIGIDFDPNQPQLAVFDRTHARAFMRSETSDRTPVSDTADAGWSWSALSHIDVENHDRPVAVAGLGMRSLLMVYSGRAQQSGVQTNLVFATSTDGGSTWSNIHLLEERPTIDVDMRYPWLATAHDGLFHLVFTRFLAQGSEIISVRFNRAWIAARGGPACP
jgi:predicted neuraminidase